MEPTPQIIQGPDAEGCASAGDGQQVRRDRANATSTRPPTHASGPTTARDTLQPFMVPLLHGIWARVDEPCKSHPAAGVGGGAAAEPKGNQFP
jgi:hypothetical protein